MLYTCGEERRWDELREEHGNIHITICKIESQWELAVWHRELNPVLCDNPEGWDGVGDGRGVQREGTYDPCDRFIVFQLFVSPTLWTAAHQACLSITNSWSLLKLISIESVMPSNHLILCHPLLLLPSILPSIRVFSNESVLHIRWPKYWSFSFSISPSNEYSGLISLRMDWLDLLAVQGTLKSLL